MDSPPLKRKRQSSTSAAADDVPTTTRPGELTSPQPAATAARPALQAQSNNTASESRVTSLQTLVNGASGLLSESSTGVRVRRDNNRLQAGPGSQARPQARHSRTIGPTLSVPQDLVQLFSEFVNFVSDGTSTRVPRASPGAVGQSIRNVIRLGTAGRGGSKPSTIHGAAIGSHPRPFNRSLVADDGHTKSNPSMTNGAVPSHGSHASGQYLTNSALTTPDDDGRADAGPSMISEAAPDTDTHVFRHSLASASHIAPDAVSNGDMSLATAQDANVRPIPQIIVYSPSGSVESNIGDRGNPSSMVVNDHSIPLYPAYEKIFESSIDAGLWRGTQLASGGPWIAPDADPTIEEVESNRDEWVQKLYDAFINRQDVQDNKRNAAYHNFVENRHYDPIMIQAVCHDILTVTRTVCMEGFSLGPHHDLTQRKNVKQITEDRKLNCRQRVEAIVEVLTYEKKVCDDMMKAPDGGEIIEKFVNAPLESAQVKKDLRKTNAKRSETAAAGKEARLKLLEQEKQLALASTQGDGQEGGNASNDADSVACS